MLQSAHRRYTSVYARHLCCPHKLRNGLDRAGKESPFKPQRSALVPLAAAAVSILWGVVVMFRLVLVSSDVDSTRGLGLGELLARVDPFNSVSCRFNSVSCRFCHPVQSNTVNRRNHAYATLCAGVSEGDLAGSRADEPAARAAGGGAVPVHCEERQRARNQAAAAPGPCAAMELSGGCLTAACNLPGPDIAVPCRLWRFLNACVDDTAVSLSESTEHRHVNRLDMNYTVRHHLKHERTATQALSMG